MCFRNYLLQVFLYLKWTNENIGLSYFVWEKLWLSFSDKWWESTILTPIQIADQKSFL